MDFIATVLGLQLPTLKARDILKSPRYYSGSTTSSSETFRGRGGGSEQDVLMSWEVPDKTTCDDDETASTVSEGDDTDDASFSSSSDSCCVTFAAPLVTQVHLRPYTDRTDKHLLYYNESDYRTFRHEFRQSLRLSSRRQANMNNKRRPLVTFSSTVVSHVHCLPAVENKHEVYYSSTELKQFLEDFILSLEGKQC